MVKFMNIISSILRSTLFVHKWGTRCSTKEAGLFELLTASGKQIGNSSEEQKQTELRAFLGARWLCGKKCADQISWNSHGPDDRLWMMNECCSR